MEDLEAPEVIADVDVFFSLVECLVGLWFFMRSFEGFNGISGSRGVHVGGRFDTF